MAQMNARMNPGGMGAASSAGKGAPAGVPQHPAMVQPGTIANHANAAGKPGSTAHPNQNVLEAVKKVQEEAKNQSLEQRAVAGRVVGPGQQQAMQQPGMMANQQQPQQNMQNMQNMQQRRQCPG